MKKLLLTSIVFVCSSAFALNLKEQQTLKYWKDSLAKTTTEGYAGEVVKKCGYEIPADIDEKMVTPFMAENASGWSYCDSVYSTLSGMCEDKLAKDLIKKNIKKLSCKLGKKEEATFKLEKGTLTFTYGVGASNLNDKVKDFLENNLK